MQIGTLPYLSLIHISEPTRLLSISYAVFCLKKKNIYFFLMIRRPPRSTLDRSSAASDVYKRQVMDSRTPAEPKPDADRNLAIQLLKLVAPMDIATDFEDRLR